MKNGKIHQAKTVCVNCGYELDDSIELEKAKTRRKDNEAIQRDLMDAVVRKLKNTQNEMKGIVKAAEEVWDSTPSTYDEKHPTVKRHARALNQLRIELGKIKGWE